MASSAKYTPNSFTNEDLNLLLTAEVQGDSRVGLRNYFLQRASLSQNVHAILTALRGLKSLLDVPLVVLEGAASISTKEAKPEVSIRLVDNFGQTYAAAKSVKGVLAQLDGVKSSKDANLKFNKDNTQATLALTGTAVGKYRLNVTIDGVNVISPLFTVTEALKFRSASYQVTQSLKFPASLDQTITQGEKVKNLKNA